MRRCKLVRDRIPQIMIENQKNPVTHTADDREYWERLKDKLKEEVNEFLENGNREELADILEVDIKTVGSRLNRGINMIRDILEKKGALD